MFSFKDSEFLHHLIYLHKQFGLLQAERKGQSSGSFWVHDNAGAHNQSHFHKSLIFKHPHSKLIITHNPLQDNGPDIDMNKAGPSTAPPADRLKRPLGLPTTVRTKENEDHKDKYPMREAALHVAAHNGIITGVEDLVAAGIAPAVGSAAAAAASTAAAATAAAATAAAATAAAIIADKKRRTKNRLARRNRQDKP